MEQAEVAASGARRLDKQQLADLIELLKRRGYRTIGPQVRDAAVVYDDLDSIEQLPVGSIDDQDGGLYRLHQDPDAGYFDHVVGPHSLKNFVFPPRDVVQRLHRTESGWEVEPLESSEAPLAIIGARSCDLHALRIQDRVFLEGPFVDPAYAARRRSLFLVAVNCRRAAATCFCHSMRTGPAVEQDYDLVLTELDDVFVVQAGTEQGVQVLSELGSDAASAADRDAARRVSSELLETLTSRDRVAAADGHPDRVQRALDTEGIRDLLLHNLEHAQWQDVADRCLACGNCTMVCPTCFCSTVDEVTDLTGEHVERQRQWASCFSNEHSAMSTGPVRPSIKAQYRQWLTHKLASWIDQFGESGCVGCGRCITWCPVGIDLTSEVAAIRGETA